MKFTIPVISTVELNTQQVEMGGKFYDLIIRYNPRDEHFMLDISRENVVLISGIKLVCGNDLLAQYLHTADLPKGKLNIVDSLGGYADPTKDNFGVTVQLQYED